MAQALQCDRCKTCYPRQISVPSVKVFADYSSYGSDEKIDLCPKCQKELEDFLNFPKNSRTDWAK